MQIIVPLVLDLKLVIIVYFGFIEVASDCVDEEDEKADPHKDDHY
jgi:hypothetical protein